jgi:hypothetical protein
MRVQVSALIRAPRDSVSRLYADFLGWGDLFPTISAVRVVRRAGPKVVLEVDHVEGVVLNVLEYRSVGEIELWESKRRYDATFSNRFEIVADGTLFTVLGNIELKGWARLLRPFLGGYVRAQMRRYQLAPIKCVAEARFRG